MNEVVSNVAAEEKAESAMTLMQHTILKQLHKFEDGDGLITKTELDQVLSDGESQSILRSLSVDRLFLCELEAMLFPSDTSKIPINRVVELMFECRGDHVTTVHTFATGLLYISSLIRNLELTMKNSMRDFVAEQHMGMARVAGYPLGKFEDDCHSESQPEDGIMYSTSCHQGTVADM